MIEIGTLLQDRYLIQKKIGAGGMGAVYLAIDRRFDSHVAIKETFYKDDEFGEAFEREARLLNALQHPVLPHVTDYFDENNGYFLVMQFIEGEDLSEILKRQTEFPAGDVVRWTNSLLDALDYLHSQQPPIIHRDIKPHNLKLTPRGEIMLLDFGLAKLNYEDKSGEISVFGYSRTYSPLEQIQGTGTDARSDIFSLGATVYHLLTGGAPVNALTRAAAIVNGGTDPIRPVHEFNAAIPESVASVVQTALALNPENRFVSARAMRQALDFAVADLAGGNGAEKNAAAAPSAPAKSVIAAGNQNFPALAAFASGAKGRTSAAPPEAAEDVTQTFDENAGENSRPGFLPSPKIVIETPRTAVPAGHKIPSYGLLVVLALVAGLGVAAAMFFSGGENAAEETNQLPAAQTSPTVKPNRKTANPAAPDSESLAETKPKPAELEKSTDKGKPETSPNESGNGESNISESPVRKAPAVKRNGSTDSDQPQPEEIDDPETVEPVEIEPENPVRENRNPRNRNERRRREPAIPDEMSEEEFRRLQRELKQKRRERNNQPPPDGENF